MLKYFIIFLAILNIVYAQDNTTNKDPDAAYLSQWNKLINRDIRDNLTEDVNSFIRDYMRRVLRTLPANHFTRERVHELAETLVKTPGMQRIRDHDQLCMYVELYIIKLVKNL